MTEQEGKIVLEQEEFDRFINTMNAMQNIYILIGRLRDNETELLSKLSTLKATKTQWEGSIEKKYHLPSGVDWRIHPETREVVILSGDAQEEAAEAAETAGTAGKEED